MCRCYDIMKPTGRERCHQGGRHGEEGKGFSWLLCRALLMKTLTFYFFPFIRTLPILQSLRDLLTCSEEIHGERLSWSKCLYALNMCKRKKNISYNFLLSCQEYTGAFHNVIDQLPAYPERLFSAVRKESTALHS